MGSGKIFQRAITKYGKENFKRNIIDIAYTENELNQKEYEYSVFFDVVNSDDWYNLVLGGGGVSGYHLSEEAKQKIRETNFGRRPSEETRQKMSRDRAGENNYWYGKTIPEDVRQKISASRKGKYTGKDNPNYGNHKLAGQNHPNYGKPISEEQKQKIRLTIGDSRKGSKNANYGNHKLTGKNNPRCMPIYCVEFDRIFWGSKGSSRRIWI